MEQNILLALQERGLDLGELLDHVDLAEWV